MEKHLYFDLWLHSNTELSHLLSTTILERETLHEWPLSCVQRLTLSGGHRLIYKVQTTESVEADFYALVSSPLLPGYQLLGTHGKSIAMLFEYIDAPKLDEIDLSEADILRHGRALVEAVQQIGGQLNEGDLPVYADLSSLELWQRFVDETLMKLSVLITTGQFPNTPPETVSRLAEWAISRPVQQAFQGKMGLAHADLSGGNVFLTPTGYKIIDWQYPRRMPDGIDLAVYLDFMGCDPYRYMDAAIVNIAWFIRVAWYVHSKADLMPQIDRYEGFVIDFAGRLLSKTP